MILPASCSYRSLPAPPKRIDHRRHAGISKSFRFFRVFFFFFFFFFLCICLGSVLLLVLHDLGIHGDVAARLQTAPNGATAMKALAASKARRPIGCTQATEILSTPGIMLVAPLPPGCALATVYTAAIGIKAEAAAQAARLLAMLTEASGREGRQRLGFA